MPKFFNSTTITLIPKVQNPVEMGDFRPISCCNSIYKFITFILVSRLKSTLNSVVGMHQTTYVPGRMQELVYSYHRKGGKARCALKIDIRKEYDTVDWDFLWKVIAALKYPIVFIDWIRACVSTI
ncbi:hypothetical protein LIER_30438 [Lithospermum erythrorhizon]|uniref:Reverse transcriptase domain-containing protein n=1 Tax=Lithospermum erythrorhizon TaxID=34254 RepID=A0AAV3RR89_LITER